MQEEGNVSIEEAGALEPLPDPSTSRLRELSLAGTSAEEHDIGQFVIVIVGEGARLSLHVLVSSKYKGSLECLLEVHGLIIHVDYCS